MLGFVCPRFFSFHFVYFCIGSFRFISTFSFFFFFIDYLNLIFFVCLFIRLKSTVFLVRCCYIRVCFLIFFFF